MTDIVTPEPGRALDMAVAEHEGWAWWRVQRTDDATQPPQYFLLRAGPTKLWRRLFPGYEWTRVGTAQAAGIRLADWTRQQRFPRFSATETHTLPLLKRFSNWSVARDGATFHAAIIHADGVAHARGVSAAHAIALALLQTAPAG